MSRAHSHKPHQPSNDVPEEFEPGTTLPVEPDEGPVPAFIPEDPEHNRLVDPAATAGWAGPAYPSPRRACRMSMNPRARRLVGHQGHHRHAARQRSGRPLVRRPE